MSIREPRVGEGYLPGSEGMPSPRVCAGENMVPVNVHQKEEDIMRSIATAAITAALLALAVSVSAVQHHVPSQYSTVQAGINAAANGDTVMVAPGTYTGAGNRDIDFGGKLIVVMSSGGPNVTVLDCQASSLDPHRGFIFQTGEDSTAVVQGFTIRNGWEGDGGGIAIINSSPKIVGNTIEGCQADVTGGAIFCYQFSSAIMRGNKIAGNSAMGGGGIYCWEGTTATIDDNTFDANAAMMEGGGIFLYVMCGGTISGNRIIGNTAGGMGGGICVGGSFPTITGNTIMGNAGELGGGGIACWYYSSPPSIDHNMIVENISGGTQGGGIYCYQYSSPVIDRNTISGNLAMNGGGIACDVGCNPTVINSILWADVATTNQEIYVGSTSSIAVTYSDVDGGWAGLGNINLDPMFAQASYHDYRLLWGSPCIDSGDPTATYNDPDGTRCDMGGGFFDQNDYMTLYLAPHATWVQQGGQLVVTYTVINRWAQAETFWVQTDVTLPNGNTLTVMGPTQYTLPPNSTVQQALTHNVPGGAPLGTYTYRSRIGVPPATLYDKDSFVFTVFP